jgi:tetratricopeptide (TPR) repeat protein
LRRFSSFKNVATIPASSSTARGAMHKIAAMVATPPATGRYDEIWASNTASEHTRSPVPGSCASARRENPEPTVGYFRDLCRQHPGDARALFEYAGALDYAGREAEAAPVYEQAFSAGLDGDDLCRGLIQYGSTLRNLGRFDEAVSALRRADERFPGHDSIAAFLTASAIVQQL